MVGTVDIEQVEYLEQLASCLNLTCKILDKHIKKDTLPWGVPSVDLPFLLNVSSSYRDKIRQYVAPHRYALVHNNKKG